VVDLSISMTKFLPCDLRTCRNKAIRLAGGLFVLGFFSMVAAQTYKQMT
jgi:hypothetical protein